MFHIIKNTNEIKSSTFNMAYTYVKNYMKEKSSATTITKIDSEFIASKS